MSVAAIGGSSFFQNRDCPYFPCHEGVREEAFNCLFCYCPLYCLGSGCGGGYTFTESGVKSCAGCAFPHEAENYGHVLLRLREVLRRVREAERSRPPAGGENPALPQV